MPPHGVDTLNYMSYQVDMILPGGVICSVSGLEFDDEDDNDDDENNDKDDDGSGGGGGDVGKLSNVYRMECIYSFRYVIAFFLKRQTS